MNTLGSFLAAAIFGTAVSGMLAAAITGFAPMFALRMFMLIYPPGDERPEELLREMYGLKKIEQAWWVGQQIATVLFDGVPARRSYVRKRRAERARQRRIEAMLRKRKHNAIVRRQRNVHAAQAEVETAQAAAEAERDRLLLDTPGFGTATLGAVATLTVGVVDAAPAADSVTRTTYRYHQLGDGPSATGE